MTADDLTRPERAAQIRQAKRYRAAIEKRGTCCACKHRNREVTFWGRNVCRVDTGRQYPACQQDGRGVVFEFDETTLGEFRDDAAA